MDYAKLANGSCIRAARWFSPLKPLSGVIQITGKSPRANANCTYSRWPRGPDRAQHEPAARAGPVRQAAGNASPLMERATESELLSTPKSIGPEAGMQFDATLTQSSLRPVRRLCWHGIRTALVIIIALLIAIAATMIAASRVERLAAWLLAPYLLWVTYATTINIGVVAMN